MLHLGNMSKNFTIYNMKNKKKNRIKRKCKRFLFDYNAIDTSDILDIHRYLILFLELFFRIIKKMFIVLLTSLVNACCLDDASSQTNVYL